MIDGPICVLWLCCSVKSLLWWCDACECVCVCVCWPVKSFLCKYFVFIFASSNCPIPCICVRFEVNVDVQIQIRIHTHYVFSWMIRRSLFLSRASHWCGDCVSTCTHIVSAYIIFRWTFSLLFYSSISHPHPHTSSLAPVTHFVIICVSSHSLSFSSLLNYIWLKL